MLWAHAEDAMAEDVDSLTIRLLQEMRGDIQALQSGQRRMEDMITDLVQRIDGNTLVFNLVAGVVHDHEERITTLEGKP